MVGEDGIVKVLDFGIARRTGKIDAQAATLAHGSGPDPTGTLTGQGLVVGTPFYMAPEQMRGDTVDGRADQFAWGVVAYELLTGELPWDKDADPLKLVAQILSHDVPPPRTKNPDIPAPVNAVVRMALSKAATSRFASMEEIADELDAHAAPTGVTTGRSSARRSVPSLDDVGLAPTQSFSSPESEERHLDADAARVALGGGGRPLPESAMARADRRRRRGAAGRGRSGVVRHRARAGEDGDGRGRGADRRAHVADVVEPRRDGRLQSGDAGAAGRLRADRVRAARARDRARPAVRRGAPPSRAPRLRRGDARDAPGPAEGTHRARVAGRARSNPAGRARAVGADAAGPARERAALRSRREERPGERGARVRARLGAPPHGRRREGAGRVQRHDQRGPDERDGLGDEGARTGCRRRRAGGARVVRPVLEGVAGGDVVPERPRDAAGGRGEVRRDGGDGPSSDRRRARRRRFVRPARAGALQPWRAAGRGARRAEAEVGASACEAQGAPGAARRGRAGPPRRPVRRERID